METLRDSPEISPWRSSGKLDWTMLTDGVSIVPIPRPISSSPGTNVATPEVSLTSASNSTMPARVTRKPARISVLCARRLAKRSAASEEIRMPAVAAVKTRPESIAL